MQPSPFAAYKDPIPLHEVTEPKAPGGDRTIAIAGWTVATRTTHIMSAAQIDEAAQHLALPLPEMTFADNRLSLAHAGSGVRIDFGALVSLAEVKVGEGWDADGGGVKVKHAEAWGKTRSTGPSPLLSDGPLPTKPIKPFDWTYSTLHAGAVSSPAGAPTPSWRPADPEAAGERIPLELLSRPDPILFYDDVPLFESELDDNGSSVLSARVRVMPHSLFVLFRHFLRVDGVLFRTHDVRLFHAFGSAVVVRETAGWEAGYDAVKASALPPPYADPSLLSDQGWVHQVLSAKGRRRPAPVKLEDGQKPWPGLGCRVEVLELRPAAAATYGASSGGAGGSSSTIS